MKALKVSALLSLVAVAAWAADDVVVKETTGEAAIVDGNKARAEKEAKDAALREAVEQVAGVMVSSDTLTQNSQLIQDRIYSNSAGYIKKYDVLSKKEEGGVMQVTVRAQVGTKELDKDLQAVQGLIRRLGNRKLVIILQEQTIDQTETKEGIVTSTNVMSTALTDVFKNDGWTIIDPQFAQGRLKLGSAVGPAQVKEADLTKADYLLYGQVRFRNQAPEGMLGAVGKGQNIFPVTGEYDLTCFATDSGSQVAQVSGKMVMPKEKVNQTLLSYERTAFNLAKLQGDQLVKDIRKAVVEYLRNSEVNGNRVVMNVVGLNEYSEVQGFKKVLAESINGVREVRPGSFGSGKAQFDVFFMGSTDDLADRVGGKTFRKRKISVTGVTGNTVELTLAR